MTIFTLSQEYKKLQDSRCEVVVFVQSSTENIQKNIFGRHDEMPKFSIISDQEKDAYSLFGVASNSARAVSHIAQNASKWIDAAVRKGFPQADVDGDLFMVPAAFLVDRSGRIEFVDYDMNFYDEAALEQVHDLLKQGHTHQIN